MTNEHKPPTGHDPHRRNDGMAMSFGLPGGGDAGQNIPQPEVRALPFRIVVLDGFAGDATPPSHPVAATAADLDELLKAFGTRLTFEVANRLASSPRELGITLRFGRMRDFRAKSIAAQIPELVAVQRVRERLSELRAGRIDAAQVQRELEPVRGFDALSEALMMALGQPLTPPAPPSAAADDDLQSKGRELLDELLGGDTAPTSPAPTPRRPSIDDVLSSVASTNKPAPQPSVARAIERIDEIVTAQLREVLSAGPLQQLERAWRSVQFLLPHANADRSSVRFELLAVGQGNVFDAFATFVHGPECRGETEHPLAMACIGLPIENRQDQLQALRELWQQAEEIQAPVLWSPAADFLVAGGLRSLLGRDGVRPILEAPNLTKWHALRNDDAARWSAACGNRFALRGATEGANESPTLWGEASYFAAAVIARCVATTGWPTAFTGKQAGWIEGLPIDNGSAVEAPLTEAIVEDLAAAGMLALTCTRGRDDAILLRAPSAHEAKQYGNRDQQNEASRRSSSLPYQLLTARIAATTMHHKAELVADRLGGPEAIRARFTKFLQTLLAATGPDARVAIATEPDREQADTTWLHCSLRTGSRTLGGAEMTFSLRA